MTEHKLLIDMNEYEQQLFVDNQTLLYHYNALKKKYEILLKSSKETKVIKAEHDALKKKYEILLRKKTSRRINETEYITWENQLNHTGSGSASGLWLHIENNQNTGKMNMICEKIKREGIVNMSLYKNSLSDDDIFKLCRFLRFERKELNEVWLHGNNITSQGMKELVKTKKFIKGLWIYDNPCQQGEYRGRYW